jgi:uncharacterized membrane protein
LSVIGFILTAVSYFIVKSAALTAVCISMVIVGITDINIYRGKSIDLKIRSVLLVSLALAFSAINVLLALSHQSNFVIYFVVIAITYFAISWVFIAINPKLRTALTSVGFIVFAGFLAIMVSKVVEILK